MRMHFSLPINVQHRRFLHFSGQHQPNATMLSEKQRGCNCDISRMKIEWTNIEHSYKRFATCWRYTDTLSRTELTYFTHEIPLTHTRMEGIRNYQWTQSSAMDSGIRNLHNSYCVCVCVCRMFESERCLAHHYYLGFFIDAPVAHTIHGLVVVETRRIMLINANQHLPNFSELIAIAIFHLVYVWGLSTCFKVPQLFRLLDSILLSLFFRFLFPSHYCSLI